MKRLALFTAAALLVLVGCATPTATTDTQVLADATGIVANLTSVVAEINALKPGAVPPNVTADLTAAQALVVTLSATTPAATGATTLQKIDADISGVLNAAAPVAATIDPGAGIIIAAIQALLPSVEAWVNPLITSATGVGTAAAVAPAAPVSATALAAARKTLLIPVVK